MYEQDSLGPYQNGGGQYGHPNPQFDYLSGFTPRKLKDLIRQAEYIGFNSAHIYGVVRKFGEYPITKLVYETASESERLRHEKLFEKDLRFKGFLTLVSFDVWLTGNSFVSVYEPIKRDLRCPHCKIPEDVAAADYSFHLDRLEFRHTCRACGKRDVISEVIDQPLREPGRIKLRRWDPKLIDIDTNLITGEDEYYYTIPRSFVAEVRAGNKLKINHTPMEFLAAMRDRKIFKFAPDAIYHMRMPGPAGEQGQWGFPPITAAIKMFLFAAVLRRANEAIALEHITPFRVMHPTAASGQGDPLTTINLGRWRQELEGNYKAFRKDPLRIMFSPIPVGVQNIGGEGRTLLTLGELQEAEKNIVLSLGVPMEFLTGGLGQTRGDVTLRMIENQLRTHIENLNGLSQWVESRVTSFLKWTSIPVKLQDFKMTDDADVKQFKLQMWAQGKLSDTTMAEAVDVDLHNERKLQKQEKLDQARIDSETQIAIQKQQTSLSLSSQQRALQSQGGMAYDPQQILAANAPLAEELGGMDEGTRRSRLDALQGEDPVAYAVVKMLLEQQTQNQDAQVKQEAQQGLTGG